MAWLVLLVCLATQELVLQSGDNWLAPVSCCWMLFLVLKVMGFEATTLQWVDQRLPGGFVDHLLLGGFEVVAVVYRASAVGWTCSAGGAGEVWKEGLQMLLGDTTWSSSNLLEPLQLLLTDAEVVL